MTITDVLDYALKTPENTNRQVLNSMLKALVESNAPKVEVEVVDNKLAFTSNSTLVENNKLTL